MFESSILPIQILWEDDDLVVVQKPHGILVDAGQADVTDDLLALVRVHGLGYENVFAFHRLDRETSGVVMLGKTRKFAKQITQAFEEKRIRKAYLAVVSGEWPPSLGRVDQPIGERESVTTFRRLAVGEFSGDVASLLECLPKTGRNHQIRIHCAHSGHAILGDARYTGGSASKPTLLAVAAGTSSHALHAYRLDFRHPADGREILVRCEPKEWRSLWLKNFAIDSVWDKLFGRGLIG